MKEFNTGCQKSCSKHMEGTSKQEKYRESLGEEKKKRKPKIFMIVMLKMKYLSKTTSLAR